MALPVERRAVGEAEPEAVARRVAVGPRAAAVRLSSVAPPVVSRWSTAPKLARGAVVEIAERRVETPHAAESGGERDVGHAEIGLVEQPLRGVHAAGADHRQRRRAEVALEHALQMARGDPDALGDAGDSAIVVERLGGDEAQRAGRRSRARRTSPGYPDSARGGSAGTGGIRRRRPPRRWGRTPRCARAAASPGTPAGSRCGWCAPR